jgi:hypothetical protein
VAAESTVLRYLTLGLVVRTGEVAFGLVALVAGGIWIFLCGVVTLHYGLGVGTEEYRGEALEVEPHHFMLALFCTLTVLGLAPLSLGAGFLFGAGPFAKPELQEGSSRRALLAVTVEVLAVVAMLVLALLVVRQVFSGPYPQCCSSVSNAPGP